MKSFCFNCSSECDAVLHKRKMRYIVKDKEVEIIGKYLVCPICGKEANNDKISEENIEKSLNEYKIKNSRRENNEL